MNPKATQQMENKIIPKRQLKEILPEFYNIYSCHKKAELTY